ncbi:MAG: class I SAM-dependent methyltransferase [Gemmatimonadaceae bacterium]
MSIEHISDTARWVAVYRAMESERPDAIFRDPYARRLAGERGEAIVGEMKRGRQMAWAMVVRTAVMDEIILDTIARGGADLVLNLAAGLDARPWRLALPPTLRWVDVDYPDILAYKRETIGDAAPRCEYEALPADLTDASARRALFAHIGAASQRVLVVSEGLLIYLTADQVGALAVDLHAQPGFHWWLIDLAHPQLLAMMQKSWGKKVAQGNAPFRFAPADGTAFFRTFGWRETQFRSAMDEARRLDREMPGMWLWRFIARFHSTKRREVMRRFNGFVLLERE